MLLYLLCWYKSTNTDAAAGGGGGAAGGVGAAESLLVEREEQVVLLERFASQAAVASAEVGRHVYPKEGLQVTHPLTYADVC